MSDVADAGVSVETPTSTAPVVESPAAASPPPPVPEAVQPSPEIPPVETPAPEVPQPSRPPSNPVTDKSSERFSATPPPSQAGPALRQGPDPVSPPTNPTAITPDTIAAPAASYGVNIKDRLYAALEKVQFRKRAKLEKIIVLAKAKRSIKNDDVEKLLRVSDATATNYLSQLVREGKLKRSGIRAGTVYELV
ncbi:hypothetical protein JNK62_04430 [bacterium]|nr:hypothetical protein [bacterium]